MVNKFVLNNKIKKNRHAMSLPSLKLTSAYIAYYVAYNTAKVSEQVNRKCPRRNTILQLYTSTRSPQTFHLLT